MPNVSIQLQHALYDPRAIPIAVREFAHLCSVSLTTSESTSEIVISPATGAPDETVDEFLNFVLCASLEYRFSV
jgi:hypothetical protein